VSRPLQSLFDDLAAGWRSLRLSRGSAGVAVVSLALGMGACSLVFSAVYSVLVRPLPFAAPERLVAIDELDAQGRLGQVRPENYSTVTGVGLFEDATAYLRAEGPLAFNVSADAEPERVAGAIVSENFFRLLGLRAASGRTIQAGDEYAPVAVVSDTFWRRAFGGDPGLVGRPLRVNGRLYTVVGILSPGVSFPGNAELWVPGPFEPRQVFNDGVELYPSVQVIARLHPGTTAAAADRALRGLAGQLLNPLAAAGGASAVPLQESLGRNLRPPLLLLSAAVGLVLLLACINLANWLLLRAAARQRDFAVRLALGASRGRLLRQLTAEGLAFAVLGAAGGLALYALGTGLLRRILPAELTAVTTGQAALPVLGIAGLLVLGTAVLCGLLPGLQVARRDLIATLGGAGHRASGGRGLQRVQGVLIAGELALALALLSGATAVLRTVAELLQEDLGFRPAGVLTARLSLSGEAYQDDPSRQELFRRFLERAAAAPGVGAVGLADGLPLAGGGIEAPYQLEGQAPPEPGEFRSVKRIAVAGSYFEALGISAVRGRLLGPGDRAGAAPVVVVDETFARAAWPGEDPLGRRFQLFAAFPEVVGVVRPVQTEELGHRSAGVAFVPLGQLDSFVLPHAFVAARTDGPAHALEPGLRQALRELDPGLPLSEVQTFDERAKGAISQQRLTLALLAGFAVASLALSAVGLSNVMALFVRHREQEIGIRRALGARDGAVVGLVLRRGAGLILAGLCGGVALAVALARGLGGLVVGLRSGGFTALAAAAVVLAAVALAAVLVPARRAVRLDPLATLRQE
jgi:putative ABC transport system permease protein